MAEEPIPLGADKDLPARADALQNRAEIIAAARNLFDSHSVDQVSMTQIAREARVGKGTLYRHFRNKSDLCMALLDSKQKALQNETLAYLRQSSAPSEDKLFWFLEQLCDYTEANINLLVETVQGRLEQGAFELDHPAHHWQWLTIVGLLRSGSSGGDRDVEYLADVLYALLDPRFYHFQRFVRGYDPQRIRAGLLQTARYLFY
ncbi:MAG: TetR/AcrR family transcriptional regulator [Chloroflexi bacterium]|nr:TetR/AcrR family transcriptional regulator [Chloroflexota bacterium]